MELLLLNGQPGHLPLDNRGLAFGDGLFETIHYRHGSLLFLQPHLRRLASGAERLKLNWTLADQQNLESQLHATLATVDDEHVIKIMLVRRSPGRGYAFDAQHQAVDCIVIIKPYQRPAWAQHGANVEISPIFVSENPSLAGIKHLNRLDSVLARAATINTAIHEVLLATANGLLVEGSMSNIFLWDGQKWETPSITRAGVAGIIRASLLASFNDIKESEINIEKLNHCQAAFITNSLIGLVPVLTLNARALKIHPDISRFSDRLLVTC